MVDKYPRREPRAGTRKLILSRKGWDSDWGGCASPILPDGRTVSLPIPEPEHGAANTYHTCRTPWGETFAELLGRMGVEEVRCPWPAGRKTIPLGRDPGVHLDPDLRFNAADRPNGWQALFGQSDQAQHHLDNEGVSKGDLFLFYGLYRNYKDVNGRIRPHGRPMHMIWGWLEVGNRRTVDDLLAEQWSWAADHPHVTMRRSQRYRDANTLYRAPSRSSWSARTPGAGTFREFRSELILTETRQPLSQWRVSRWRLPVSFHPTRTWSPLTYHARRDRWGDPAGGFVRLDTVGRGQEFIVEASDEIVNWANGIITNNG